MSNSARLSITDSDNDECDMSYGDDDGEENDLESFGSITPSIFRSTEEGLDEDGLTFDSDERNNSHSDNGHREEYQAHQPGGNDDNIEDHENHSDDEEEELVQSLLSRFPDHDEPITYSQHQDSMLQLDTSWKDFLQQSLTEQENDFERHGDARAQELQSKMDEMRRLHEIELDECQSEVLEQSQKIIKEEMRVNLERERQTQVQIDEAIKIAVKVGNDEMVASHERALEDAKDCIRNEVKEECDKEADYKMHGFMSQYEDMKKQFVDVTWEMQQLEMNTETKIEEAETNVEKQQVLICQMQEEIDLQKVNQSGSVDIKKKLAGMTWKMQQMEMNTAAKVVEKEIKVEEQQLLISQMQNEIDSLKLKKPKQNIRITGTMETTDSTMDNEKNIEYLKKKHKESIAHLKSQFCIEKEEALTDLKNELCLAQNHIASVSRLAEEQALTTKREHVEYDNRSLDNKINNLMKINIDVGNCPDLLDEEIGLNQSNKPSISPSVLRSPQNIAQDNVNTTITTFNQNDKQNLEYTKDETSTPNSRPKQILINRTDKNSQFEDISFLAPSPYQPEIVKKNSSFLHRSKSNLRKPRNAQRVQNTATKISPSRVMRDNNVPIIPSSMSKRRKMSKQRSRSNVFASPKSLCSIPIKDKDVRLLLLKPCLTEALNKMIKSLNIEIVDDPVLCTHVIASDSVHSLRRTPRLMATLCITSNILKASWIEESYKNGTLLNCNRFLLLNDELAEKKFSFLMKNTLREGNKRRVEGGVFAGMIVLLCLNVAGNRAPKENELRMMVECAGGKMALISEFSLSENVDTSNVLIITSNPPIPPNQISSKKFNLAVANGALAFPISWMFDSFMRQKISGIKRGL